VVPSADAARTIDRLLNIAHTDPQPVHHTTIEALGTRLGTDPELIRQALLFFWSPRSRHPGQAAGQLRQAEHLRRGLAVPAH
jgi:hypothetical protein